MSDKILSMELDPIDSCKISIKKNLKILNLLKELKMNKTMQQMDKKTMQQC
jgi:hypothetical protein